jgi:AcrR family transcriptional regulator
MSINEQNRRSVPKRGEVVTEKKDRRSQRTRQLFSDAIIALIKEKGYDTITVTDIIERANVGRSTFYAHYRDKDDLLTAEFNRVIDVLERGILDESHEENLLFPSLALFRHVGEQYALYKALTWGSGVDMLIKHVQKTLIKRIEQSLQESGRDYAVPLPTLANYVAGSFLSLIKWWLENKMLYTPEKMDEVFRKLTMPGLEAQEIKSKEDAHGSQGQSPN